MPRRVSYGFHCQPDSWRASQFRNLGAIEVNAPASGNDWKQVTRCGEKAICALPFVLEE